MQLDDGFAKYSTAFIHAVLGYSEKRWQTKWKGSGVKKAVNLEVARMLRVQAAQSEVGAMEPNRVGNDG